MNPELLKRLIALEPDLRALTDGQFVSVTISFDRTGTTYSYSTNDDLGNSKTYNERILTKKA